MSNPARKLSQSVLQRSVTVDANANNLAPARVMRWVAASAFFEMLNLAVQDGRIDAYLVKGGFAVELRHRHLARTSLDMDLVITGKADAVTLLEALLPASWDSFEFRFKGKRQGDHAMRVDVQVIFNKVPWCSLALDVLDGEVTDVEHVDSVDITKYQLPRVGSVPVMTRPQQLSEWIHCTTKPPQNGKRKNRARNLVDIFVTTRYAPCTDLGVREWCAVTFAREATHPWPPAIEFPDEWLRDVAEILEDLEIEVNAQELVAEVALYIGRLTDASVPKAPIAEFRDRVAARVQEIVGPPGDRYAYDGSTWRDGVLNMTIGENGGRAFVAYSAGPSGGLGHRSSALPFAMDDDGVAQAAAFIVDSLENPYLH